MPYTQLKTPNLGITYTGGMCLEAVRTAFGIPAKYGRAIDDWNSGNKHSDAPPPGYAVPVYFSISKVPAGHIAIALPDGRIASSTKEGTHQGLYIHPSIADLIRVYSIPANGTCTYLGWSEEVNDIPVINPIGGQTMLDETTVKRAVEGAYLEATGQLPGPDIIQQKADYIQHVGGFNQVLKDIFSLGVNYVPKSQAGNAAPDISDKANKWDQLKKLLS